MTSYAQATTWPHVIGHHVFDRDGRAFLIVGTSRRRVTVAVFGKRVALRRRDLCQSGWARAPDGTVYAASTYVTMETFDSLPTLGGTQWRAVT